MKFPASRFCPDFQDSILAVNDEDGKVFLVPLKKGKATSFKFSKDDDYEDIAILQQSIFVLQSNGKLFSIDKATVQRENDQSEMGEGITCRRI